MITISLVRTSAPANMTRPSERSGNRRGPKSGAHGHPQSGPSCAPGEGHRDKRQGEAPVLPIGTGQEVGDGNRQPGGGDHPDQAREHVKESVDAHDRGAAVPR